MTEQWQELKETIIELRDSDGTGTQQEVCKFLVNYMDILEDQMQEPKTGHWIETGYVGNDNYNFECSECHHTDTHSKAVKVNYCWYCGARMTEPQESEDKE